MKAVKSHLQVERAHSANAQLNELRQRAVPVLVLAALFCGSNIPAYCFSQELSYPDPVMVSTAQGWRVTGNLNTARRGHTATLLPSGKVLVVGGFGGVSGSEILDSAEVFDPNTGTWSLTGDLRIGRVLHTATLLSNGKVLVAGGNTSHVPPDFGVTNTAELYDPDTETWSLTGSLIEPRSWHTATLLPSGRVLVAGEGAELYDPMTGDWSVTDNPLTPRYGHTATLLQDGKVLIAGGSDDHDLFTTLASAELYDPDAGTWTTAAQRGEPTAFHSATLLENGKVLIAGGYRGYSQQTSNSVQLYDPATRSWGDTGKLKRAISGHTGSLLQDGKVLVLGGVEFGSRTRPELYDPDTGIWAKTASLNTPRTNHTATLLPDGGVLVAGGSWNRDVFNSTEIGYDLVGAPVKTPKIISVSVSGKRLFVFGEKFRPGAVILLNGEEQKTRNDVDSPKTKLIVKNAGNKIKTGDKLQVRNPNGIMSQEFTFVGA